MELLEAVAELQKEADVEKVNAMLEQDVHTSKIEELFLRLGLEISVNSDTMVLEVMCNNDISREDKGRILKAYSSISYNEGCEMAYESMNEKLFEIVALNEEYE